MGVRELCGVSGAGVTVGVGITGVKVAVRGDAVAAGAGEVPGVVTGRVGDTGPGVTVAAGEGELVGDG